VRPILGVLGGMGPAATVRFLDRLVNFTVARVDQDHLNSVTMMLCDIPDRSSAISRNDDGPLVAMSQGITSLEKFGVDFIAVPCNTAMYWSQNLSELSTVPILNILTETCKTIGDADVHAVHLWGTSSTYQYGIYERHLTNLGISIIPHSSEIQSKLDDVIWSIKTGNVSGVRDRLAEPINHVSRYETNIPVVLACTEFSVVIDGEDLGIRFVDSLDCLALRCLDFAGVEHVTPEWFVQL